MNDSKSDLDLALRAGVDVEDDMLQDEGWSRVFQGGLTGIIGIGGGGDYELVDGRYSPFQFEARVDVFFRSKFTIQDVPCAL